MNDSVAANRRINEARSPTKKGKATLTTKELARRSRNQNSEYLAQRRKACPERRRRSRKEIKLPDLAFLASWREQILLWIATGNRKICVSRENFNVWQCKAGEPQPKNRNIPLLHLPRRGGEKRGGLARAVSGSRFRISIFGFECFLFRISSFGFRILIR